MHINHIFLFSLFWCLADSEDTALPRISQFLKIVHNSPASVPFVCKPTNPEPIPWDQLLYWALTLWASALITPGKGTRQPTLKLLTLPCLFLPQKPQYKLFPPFPTSVSWWNLVLPRVALCSMLWVFLGICEYNKLLPSWQSFPCLCVLLHLIKRNPGFL